MTPRDNFGFPTDIALIGVSVVDLLVQECTRSNGKRLLSRAQAISLVSEERRRASSSPQGDRRSGASGPAS